MKAQSIQRLNKELDNISNVYQIIQSCTEHYKTSSTLAEDELSVARVNSQLQDCHMELQCLQSLANDFENLTAKITDIARRMKWTVEKERIKQHRAALKRF